jgi:hypothetical protein
MGKLTLASLVYPIVSLYPCRRACQPCPNVININNLIRRQQVYAAFEGGHSPQRAVALARIVYFLLESPWQSHLALSRLQPGEYEYQQVAVKPMAASTECPHKNVPSAALSWTQRCSRYMYSAYRLAGRYHGQVLWHWPIDIQETNL